MKYLLLVFFDETARNNLSEPESQALIQESIEFDEGLRENGHLIAAHPLEGVYSAATIRFRGEKPLVTDGPFAETKEQIGGFLLIEARDLNEAIQIGSRVPVARLGGIEVRPIIEITQRPQIQPK